MQSNDDVGLLQQLIQHGGTQAFSLVPAALKNVLKEKQWVGRLDKHGKPFTSFEAFASHRLWQGLETSLDDLRVHCRKHPEVYRLLLAEIEPGREHRRPTKEETVDKVDSINLKTQGGTSALYTLKRLKRDRPDLFQVVLGGGMSPNAAAIEAGFRKQQAPLAQIQKLWAKLDQAGRKAHLTWTLKHCATCGREGAVNGTWCDACCEEGMKENLEEMSKEQREMFEKVMAQYKD